MLKLEIKIASAGTKLFDSDGEPTGKTSLAGHMWLEISRDGVLELSSGFAPSAQGQAFGVGHAYDTDAMHYDKTTTTTPFSTEITESQLAELQTFHNNPRDYGFNPYYNVLNNSCIDYTWKAMSVIGLNEPDYNGALYPSLNNAALVGRGFAPTQQMRFEQYLKGKDPDTEPTAAALKGNLILAYAIKADPLTLDLDHNGTIQTVALATSQAHFDLDANGFAEHAGWIGPNDGLLVRDLNKNGLIDNGSELFGDHTTLANGNLAANGYEALAALDSNLDGQITNQDEAWSVLQLWQDRNSNGLTDAGELIGLAEAGIQSIGTSYNTLNTLDAQGNEVLQSGAFTTSTGILLSSSTFNLARDTTDTVAKLEYAVPSTVRDLPDLAGFGNVLDLHQAMAKDPSLVQLVQEAVNCTSLSELAVKFDSLFHAWAKGPVVYGDAYQLAGADHASVDAFYGQAVNNTFNANSAITTAYNQLESAYLVKFVVQTQFAAVLEKINIRPAPDGSIQFDLTGCLPDLLPTTEANILAAAGTVATFGAVLHDCGIGLAHGASELLSSLTTLAPEGFDGLFAYALAGNLMPGLVTALTNGNDTFTYTQAQSTLATLAAAFGLQGNDLIEAKYQLENQFISGGAGDDNLTAGAGNDYLAGGSGNDVLGGNAGNDTLDGGSGADTMVGGDGNDAYYVDNAADLVQESGSIQAVGGTDQVLSSIAYTLGTNVENLTLTGTSDINGTGNGLNNVLVGNAGANTLTAMDGNDTLDGGAGADSLIGGTGNDTYIVDNAGDSVSEGANQGTDAVLSSVNYTLGSDVENLTLTGDANLNGTGNALANVIQGNAGNNVLSGLAGNDTLIGSSGNDTLDGGSGADTMTGGAGDDTYIFTDVGDTAIEAAGEGIDTVISAGQLIIPDNIENLTLTGAGNGYGNNLDNVIVGSAADNRLDGNGGNDTLFGGAGTDTLNGGAGNDSLYGEDGNDALSGGSGDDLMDGGAGNDVLYGSDGNDKLYGGAGNDALDGQVGADTMVGGTGNDGYAVENAGDTVVEQANEGTDTVYAYLTFTLPGNVENLTLLGSAVDGWGNELANILQGNDLANSLTGGAGDDTLDGGLGRDVLIGGLGNDTYVVARLVYNPDGSIKLNFTGQQYAAEDVITEDINGGIDTVQAHVGYVLAANVENMVLYDAADAAWGNELANTLIGTDLANRIYGYGGADVLQGLGGNDELYGGDQNDTLDGGAGTDTLVGGLGDDNYTVDTVLDQVVENANEGFDTVRANVNYTLTQAVSVERMELLGSVIEGSGNDVANTLVGNAYNNILHGGSGDDVLYGNTGDDTLYGDEGNDILNGQDGADAMYGGLGNDNYSVTTMLRDANGVVMRYADGTPISADSVHEDANAGTDTVYASIAFTLPDNVENMVMSGVADVGLGNALANVIAGGDMNNWIRGLDGNDALSGGNGDDNLFGGYGNDTLYGENNNDTLYGEAGVDWLTGGQGNDRLVGGADNDAYFYGVSDGNDTIAEFSGIDTLLLYGTASTLNNLSEDLLFRKVNNGRDLEISLALNGGISAGTITIAGMDVAASQVEKLKIMDGSGAQVGSTISLTSIWDHVDDVAHHVSLIGGTDAYGSYQVQLAA